MAMKLSSTLGKRALAWMQVGPPALDVLTEYRALKDQGTVAVFGVEDYSDAQIEAAHASLGLLTVQAEINLLSQPAPSTVALCERIGCRFVGYGPLLGGLLADRYLGAPRPPLMDVDHREYFYTVDAWGGWGAFQKLLQVLRRVGDRHQTAPDALPASISTVALAYVLSLPRMLSVIVGVRLGVKKDHRHETLAALALELAPMDVSEIDSAVFHSDPSCRSEQCAFLRKYRG